MDFLPKTANLQGGDTRKTPNLANHGVRQEGKTPPPRQPLKTSISRQTIRIRQTARPPPTPTPSIPLNHGISRRSLSILSNPNTLCRPDKALYFSYHLRFTRIRSSIRSTTQTQMASDVLVLQVLVMTQVDARLRSALCLRGICFAPYLSDSQDFLLITVLA
jgi:hypothetical protein